jgi:hypothetical protein
MLLEVLREQQSFKYPLDDIDLLADEFGSTEQKVRVAICNYGLFEVDNENFFYSPRFDEYLKPYLDKKMTNKINGIKGNLIKYNHISREQADKMSENEILTFMANKKQKKIPSDINMDAKKPKVIKYKNPTIEEVYKYFKENGYTRECAEKAYHYYNEANWVDSKGNKVRNWKQKMRGVWFRDEHKQTNNQSTYIDAGTF